MNNDDRFEYTYSAADHAELESIRKKYVSREESKMERLRRLDNSVSRLGMSVSITLGVIGTLVFGTGLCCIMVWNMFYIGIIIGVAGLVLIVSAYPVFGRITKKRREKLAPEILRLTDEISREK